MMMVMMSTRHDSPIWILDTCHAAVAPPRLRPAAAAGALRKAALREKLQRVTGPDGKAVAVPEPASRARSRWKKIKWAVRLGLITRNFVLGSQDAAETAKKFAKESAEAEQAAAVLEKAAAEAEMLRLEAEQEKAEAEAAEAAVAKEEADVVKAEETVAEAQATAVARMVAAGFSEALQTEILGRGIVKMTASMTVRRAVMKMSLKKKQLEQERKEAREARAKLQKEKKESQEAFRRSAAQSLALDAASAENVKQQRDVVVLRKTVKLQRHMSKDSEADRKFRVGLALERVLTFERAIQAYRGTDTEVRGRAANSGGPGGPAGRPSHPLPDPGHPLRTH